MRSLSILLSMLFVFCALPALFSQKLIAVHHEGVASFYTDLPAAYNAAVNGDTMYIPGGSFGGITLGKSLTLVGVGHHPDSTSATGSTVLASLYISEGAENSFISGILLNNELYSDGIVSNIIISRCYLTKGIRLHTGQRTNWIISENWIGFHPPSPSGVYSIYQSNGSSTDFFLSNNVIQGYAANLTSSEISNNIFLNNGSGPICDNSIIKNNVLFSNGIGNSSNSQWYNNLNAGINGGPTSSGNTGNGNYLDNVPLSTAFLNLVATNNLYPNDFHIVNPAYLGNDGTPIGIYGGAFPWKEGSLPFNPHIRSKMINSTTNPDGTLHINLVVKAQGN